MQNGTTFVNCSGTDADEMVAASSDKLLATGQGAFSLTNPSNVRTGNADSSDAMELGWHYFTYGRCLPLSIAVVSTGNCVQGGSLAIET